MRFLKAFSHGIMPRIMLLSQQDIESELSYAYLHAIASRAGFRVPPDGPVATERGSTPNFG